MKYPVVVFFVVSLGACAFAEDRFAPIADAVNAAIARNELPGAVVAVWHKNRVVYREAFGLRAKLPRPEQMSIDTIFDLASLTKPVATAPAIMLLCEKGKLALTDPVVKHLPAFAPN